MNVLAKEQILLMHARLIEEFGGSDGIRDEGLLDSALNAPFQSFEGSELYPSIVEKAAHLGYGLIKNHPFIDGNKRIGTHVMLVFLGINDIRVDYEDDDLIAVILSSAAGKTTADDLFLWLKNHIVTSAQA
ncbi:MAG: type II toxin-antitoxin system death-on-curing family toxin [Spirochaetales bacterium]|nr:type II toxin-antitoxin system death-on-curing family toxin [Spirochaetales bacterium]MEE0940341.1 type II toxin-antitoxin system death-on-curing family toxin [Bifidobacteriaceae bacterium]